MIFLGQVEALGVSNRMVFVEGLDAYDTDSTIAHKYGSEKEDIATPLVFYGGQYHHLCREHHDANGRERGYIVKVR
jgi:hypothetical protein